MPAIGTITGENVMIRKSLVTVFALAAFTLPTLAAAPFYVVKNEATKKCEVTETKPDGKTMMEVGKKSYATKAEATEAMKKMAECK
jgi:hypothetical protein